jgi:transglutaminase-like putative cysteine protease
MSVIDVIEHAARDGAEFIDHSSVDWSRVRRTRFVCHQRFHYEYPGPIRNLRHRLVVVPAECYGDQVLQQHRVSVTPAAPFSAHTDEFGNRVYELAVERVEREITFDVSTTVERTARPGSAPVSLDGASRFVAPTDLTASDERIAELARELKSTARDAHEIAERAHEWVGGALRYRHGVTAVHTSAAEALALGHGLCQDYAHLMIAICRAAGLPSRYVSGHMPGEGGSHAWVEVLLPFDDGGHLRPVGFDPTNRRRPHLGYTTVAVGRDYNDVPPTAGAFSAPYGGNLTCDKRAGLVLVEYSDGEVLEPKPDRQNVP